MNLTPLIEKVDRWLILAILAVLGLVAWLVGC